MIKSIDMPNDTKQQLIDGLVAGHPIQHKELYAALEHAKNNTIRAQEYLEKLESKS